MLLPTYILTYIQGILSAPWKFTVVYLACLLGVSHDQLTRALHRRYPFQQVLAARITRKRDLSQGYLIIDETEVDKSWCTKLPLLTWIKSHRGKPYIYGHHLVVLAWTDGVTTYPLRWKIYQPGSGKTKLDLAKELLAWALERQHIEPKAVLFDAFYSQGKILTYLHERHLVFYTQLKKNRLFNHCQLRDHHQGRPYWHDSGTIKGKIVVEIVKVRRKYFATNQQGVSRKELLDTYRLRWKIEEIFRFTKSQLGLEKCQLRSLQAQSNHFNVCFLLYSILQDISHQTGLTLYQIKEKATLDRSFVDSLNVSSYLSGA